ncbi:hypothetical protein [Deinococcus hohokamensis]|uniref:Uncharacterized protein n=1 Tax=Deinococcus hohokamensis TaxID=309883 RepID=A0ABV9ICA8_9DEIO
MLLAVLCGGVALAQVPGPDLSAVNIAWLLGLASDPVTLGILVFGVVSSIKRDLERRQPPVVWNPWLWRGLSLLTGLVLAALLHLATGRAMLALPGWPGVLLFGLVTGVIGIIGRDGLKTILTWVAGMRPATAQVTVEKTDKVEVNPAPAVSPSPAAGPTITIERPGQQATSFEGMPR